MASLPIDRALANLRTTIAAMSTNLVALETDATRTRLDQTPLVGTTSVRWGEARAALSFLWQRFTQLNDLLENATQLRGTKPRVDPALQPKIEWLVNGPSIELSTADVPLAQRGLFGPAETTIRCSPPQLLDQMRIAFDQVVAVITACAQRWGDLDAALQPLEIQLAEADRLAAIVGEQHHPELDRARSDIDALRRAGACDPLADRAVVPGAGTGAGKGAAAVGTVASCLASVTDDLRRLVQLRDNLAARLNESRALMGELRATTAAAATARAEALVKIVDPSVVDTRSVTDNVDAELARVATLSDRGDWRAADNLLLQCTTRGRDALLEAQRAVAVNQAPVASRDELRGRLDAYRAKAYRLGLLEDPAAEALYARAKTVLYTAPTNLAEAEQLVRHYQQMLTDRAGREVAS